MKNLSIFEPQIEKHYTYIKKCISRVIYIRSSLYRAFCRFSEAKSRGTDFDSIYCESSYQQGFLLSIYCRLFSRYNAPVKLFCTHPPIGHSGDITFCGVAPVFLSPYWTPVPNGQGPISLVL